MRLSIVIILALSLMAAGIAFADPDNFGGKGKAWEEHQFEVGTVYLHQNTLSHNKSSNSGEDTEKRFSQPGNAEGKANGNSVISDDPEDLDVFHPGTQVLPGSNR